MKGYCSIRLQFIILMFYFLTASGCGCDKSAFERQVSPKVTEFMNITKVALHTPRLMVFAHIDKLQQIKKDISDIKVGANCYELIEAKGLLIKGIDEVIEGSFAFARSEDDISDRHLLNGKDYLERYFKLMQN